MSDIIKECERIQEARDREREYRDNLEKLTLEIDQLRELLRHPEPELTSWRWLLREHAVKVLVIMHEVVD